MQNTEACAALKAFFACSYISAFALRTKHEKNIKNYNRM